MRLTKKNPGMQVGYVEIEPEGPVYRSQKDGLVWYPCQFLRTDEGVNLVVSYEVTDHGELMYEVVNGVRGPVPVGRPRTMTFAEFVSTHERLVQ